MGRRKSKIKSDWVWKGEPFNPTYKEICERGLYGFVYLIEDIENDKKYIGEKSFHSFSVPKGKINKKKSPSDWEYYESSNKLLNSLIKESNTDKHSKFKFSILALCADKSVMKLSELYWMCVSKALMSDKYYNENARMTIMNSYNDYDERVEQLSIEELNNILS